MAEGRSESELRRACKALWFAFSVITCGRSSQWGATTAGACIQDLPANFSIISRRFVTMVFSLASPESWSFMCMTSGEISSSSVQLIGPMMYMDRLHICVHNILQGASHWGGSRSLACHSGVRKHNCLPSCWTPTSIHASVVTKALLLFKLKT